MYSSYTGYNVNNMRSTLKVILPIALPTYASYLFCDGIIILAYKYNVYWKHCNWWKKTIDKNIDIQAFYL